MSEVEPLRMALNSELRERVAAALAREQHPAQIWPHEFECPDNLRADADAVLAALGLDDFKAAVERGAKALGWDEEMDHKPHGEQLWDEAQAVLEAALSATEGPHDGD